MQHKLFTEIIKISMYKRIINWDLKNHRTQGTLPVLPNTHLQDCLYRWHVNRLYHTCTYNRRAEDESLGTKYEANIVKTKILV
jgi:hypothetical protein